MNPLTQIATRDAKREARTDNIISFGCGVVFAVLVVAFFL